MKIILVLIIVLLTNFSNKSYSQYDFDLNDIEGNSVQLREELKKGAVFIHFWATWCSTCKDELKILERVSDKYKDSGLVLLAINIDNPKNSPKVKSFIASKGYDFTVLLDPTSSTFENFGGQNLPFSVFMDKGGNIIKTYAGFMEGDEANLEVDIKNILAAEKK
jgi:cytochrome c biogenesis protein CcmG, thiol:disulfide interchange protein DsbE